MEKHCAAADQLSLVTGRVRLLADLMLAGPDLQDASTSTVQKWKQGQKKPNGPSLKLLNLVDKKGLEALA